MNKVLGIAGVVVLAIFVLLIILHGNARYSEGKKTCETTQATAATKGVTEAAKEMEKAKNETELIPDDGLDNRGIDLGIMRKPNDY